MIIKTVSNHHDGSICLLKNGKVEEHIIAERVNHKKHSGVCEKTLEYFSEDISNLQYCKIEESHHIFHAAHSFYDSGFKKAICIVIDGMGCNVFIDDYRFIRGTQCRESVSVYLFEYPNKFELIYKEIVVPFECNIFLKNILVTSTCSPALMFQKTCESIGMQWYDAGKLMAMASYGKDNICIDDNFFIGDDLRNIKLKFNLDNFEQQCDFAKSLQIKCQERVKNIILDNIEKTGCKNVCMSGGYFLNCVSNTFIQKNIPKGVTTFIEPICGDDGISIGLAKLNWYDATKSKRMIPLKDIYFGKKQNINVLGRKVTSKDVAQLLSEKKVIGIFQSRSESGPRALGNRSLLYDPRDPNGRDKINKLKGRENYRPLAATILYEYSHKWFDMCGLKESPYMLYTLNVLSDKVPTITHVDRTCRVQTLKRSFNKHYYDLIKEFYKITSIPMLMNTSLNLAGDTIVETVDDAIRTLKDSEIDYLYFPERSILLDKSLKD
jgi:carbamoyltransferase